MFTILRRWFHKALIIGTTVVGTTLWVTGFSTAAEIPAQSLPMVEVGDVR